MTKTTRNDGQSNPYAMTKIARV